MGSYYFTSTDKIMNTNLENIDTLKQECIDNIFSSEYYPTTQATIDRFFKDNLEIINNKAHNYLELLRKKERENIEQLGLDTVIRLNQLSIYTLHAENHKQINNQNLPEKVKEYILEDFARALKYSKKGDNKFLTFENYQFLSYFEILIFKRFPVGHQNLEISGFSRKAFFRQTLKNKFRFLRLLILNKGNHPYFEMHFNAHRLRQFNQAGWQEVYQLSFELMQHYPEVRGLFGGAWFFDEKLKTISPDLHYIREMGNAAGGEFYISDNTDGAKKNALFMSKKRQDAYDKGEYTPINILLIITRNSLAKFCNLNKVD